MSLLTVDVGGANETIVRFARAGHAEPRQVGTRRYAFAGNERSMIRAEPHIIPLVGADMTDTVVATLRSIFALGTAVVCAGDVFNNGGLPVTCSGEITDEMEVGGTHWVPTLTLRQVTAPTRGVLRLSVEPSGLGSATVTIRGKRRGTVSTSGQGTTTLTLNVKRRPTVAPTGQAMTTATLDVKRKVTTSSGGRGTTAVTGTKIP